MKFTIVIILISIVCCLSNVFSQTNVFKVDFSYIGFAMIDEVTQPDNFISSSNKALVFRPSFERSFGKNFSALITFEYGKYESGEIRHINTSTNVSQVEEVYTVKGWGIMPEIRYYITSKRRAAPVGFFIGSHYRYRQVTEKFSNSKEINDTTISNDGRISDVGFNLGYKFLFSGRIGLDFLVGYGYSSGKWVTETNRDKIDSFFAKQMDGFENRFRLELSLAYFFPKIKIKPREIKVIDGPYLEH